MNTFAIVLITILGTIAVLFSVVLIGGAIADAREKKRTQGVFCVRLKNGQTFYAEDIKSVEYPNGFMQTKRYDQ